MPWQPRNVHRAKCQRLPGSRPIKRQPGTTPILVNMPLPWPPQNRRPPRLLVPGRWLPKPPGSTRTTHGCNILPTGSTLILRVCEIVSINSSCRYVTLALFSSPYLWYVRVSLLVRVLAVYDTVLCPTLRSSPNDGLCPYLTQKSRTYTHVYRTTHSHTQQA